MLLKKGLMSLAIAMPMYSSMAQAGHSALSLDALRHQCIEFRQNAQINRFNIKILCSGYYTWWEEEVGQYGLPNFGKVLTHTTCKDNRFETTESIFTLDMPQHVGTCTRYVKKQMDAPEGIGIAINIQACEDLNPAAVEAMCSQEVHAYCGDQFFEAGPVGHGDFDSSSLSSSLSSSSIKGGYGHEGQCVQSVVEVIDTCAMY